VIEQADEVVEAFTVVTAASLGAFAVGSAGSVATMPDQKIR